jgi:hypothetical protein
MRSIAPRSPLRRRLACAIAILGCVACQRATVGPPASVLADARGQLAARGKEDQRVREGFGEAGKIDVAQVRRMMHADSANTTWLKAYVARWEWPTAQQVGRENVDNAFLIVQHAVHDTGFMRAMLPKVEAAVRAGELKADEVAMLIDRLEVKAGRGQRYGTQLSLRDGKLVVDPIVDSANVNTRRKALRLSTLDEYVRKVDSAMKMP